MKKNFLVLFILTVLTALVCGCFSEEKVVTADMRGGEIKTDSKADSVAKPPQDKKRAEVSEPLSDSLEEKLRAMTLEEKVGQMIMVGIQGTELDENVRRLLNKIHFGGVILYDRNMQSLEQTKKLVDDIQAFANQKVPLFVAIDEEGGTIVRGQDFLKPAPSQESIGQSGDPEKARDWAEYNAAILRSIGVNLNFAPVADVGSQDTRSFGTEAQTVATFVDAAAKGYEAKNFLYTLKHFPGIGKSKIDPHQEVSVIEDSWEILNAEDILPFAKIIRGHDNTKFMVMIGHLKYAALDRVNSASLSPAVMTKLLRNELGFSGVVITDDLEMGAIKNNVDLSRIGVQVVRAGGDIALVCHDSASQQVVYESILEAVNRGEISEERIDESVRRILKMKAHL